MNIGMALSGGGYRATVFHLGVLEWFARMGHLNDVKFLSTVSGGSICAGMVYTAAGNKWPDDKQYRDVVLPKIRKLLMKVDLQRDLIIKAIFSPLELFKTRADDLAELMEDKFNVTGTLQDLPAEPRWIVNTACYETGKLFRLERKRMGDYLLGYIKSPKLRISEAMAASAGFPIGIGPLELRSRDYKWLQFENGKLNKAVDPPAYDTLHLWDGGVYDNLGDEPLFNPGEGWRKGVDFLVVSDASGLFKEQEYQFGVSPLKRLLDIAISQARAVRTRALVDFMKQNPGSGIFLHTDNTVRSIVDQAKEDGSLTKSPPAGALNRVLSDKSVLEAATMATHIRDLSAAEFDLLFRQGFEVANATYFSYVNQDKWLDYH